MKSTYLDTCAREASCKFLERRGYKLLEQGLTFDNVALDVFLDEDTLVFASTTWKKYGLEFPEEEASSVKVFEAAALSWLKDNSDDYMNIPLRFDVVSVVIISESKALIRHHINAFMNLGGSAS